MANTIQELIDYLETVEDKSQVYAGAIFLAEDFTNYDIEGEEIAYKSEDLAKVNEFRSIQKSIEFFYDEIDEALSDLEG